MSPTPDDPDDLLARINALLAEPDPDPADDPFSWHDAMTWVAPIATHAPDGRVFLDAAGWLV